MMRAALIFPHHLYADHPAIVDVDLCVFVEDPLFFRQYCFHAHKLILHRASMQAYARRLKNLGHQIRYVGTTDLLATGDVGRLLRSWGVGFVRFVDPCDDWLYRRLVDSFRREGLEFSMLEDPHFLTPRAEFDSCATARPGLQFREFYISQRRRLSILIDAHGRPAGGKWSYDSENRRKLPLGIAIPPVVALPVGVEVREAIAYVRSNFPRAPGIGSDFHFPVTHAESHRYLESFLDERLENFGPYEDAIDREEPFLFHSVLTPALNIGLLSPGEVVAAALKRRPEVPLQSLEGFIRQIIGWREYMRVVYLRFGRRQRMSNFWDHSRSIPSSFYDGTTGMEPVDIVIRRVLRHSYCHHIERLMVLGNFMLLCEIEPHEVYRWFMELFIDAYDWVMVPNVYGMSQYADGGLITTKPYLSGSGYVLRMSNFRKGPWCEIWDGLYWRFIHRHRTELAANPRMSMITAQCQNMGSRLSQHLHIADTFLQQLHR